MSSLSTEMKSKPFDRTLVASVWLHLWLLLQPCVLLATFCAVLSRFSHVQLCDPMDHNLQPPLSMGLSRQEYWSGLPCLPPGDIPDLGIEPTSPVAPATQVNALPLSHRGSSLYFLAYFLVASIASSSFSSPYSGPLFAIAQFFGSSLLNNVLLYLSFSNQFYYESVYYKSPNLSVLGLRSCLIFYG